MGVFGINVLAFVVTSNHLQVVLQNRPDTVKASSDNEARGCGNCSPLDVMSRATWPRGAYVSTSLR